MGHMERKIKRQKKECHLNRLEMNKNVSETKSSGMLLVVIVIQIAEIIVNNQKYISNNLSLCSFGQSRIKIQNLKYIVCFSLISKKCYVFLFFVYGPILDDKGGRKNS